ncbi:hypothetical protein ACFLQL_03245 [Verrucomicrobiota bacterium]
MENNHMLAGFARVDISPEFFPVRTYLSTADKIVDPLYVRAASFSDGRETVVMVAFDVVILEWEYVRRMREQFASVTGLPERNLLVCATHNHACPAVVERPGNPNEPAYIEFMIERGVTAATIAFKDMEPVTVACGSAIESRVSFNRRFIMKNGTVITQPPSMEDILCNEGVIDPGVEVMAFRRPDGAIKGVLVNFACHAVHLMGQLSAGYPGVLCDRLQARYGADFGCVFLNGACGNIHHCDFTDSEKSKTLTREFVGGILADDVQKILEDLSFAPGGPVAVNEEYVHIRYRDITEMERNIDNPDWFVNVFPLLIKLDFFRWSLAKLKALHAESDGIDAVVQVIRLGDVRLAAIPAEYFTEFGLKIKEQSPVPTWVVSLANGWLGYIPTPEALARKGGHETTLMISSKMEPAAGDLLADAAIKLINENREP